MSGLTSPSSSSFVQPVIMKSRAGLSLSLGSCRPCARRLCARRPDTRLSVKRSYIAHRVDTFFVAGPASEGKRVRGVRIGEFGFVLEPSDLRRDRDWFTAPAAKHCTIVPDWFRDHFEPRRILGGCESYCRDQVRVHGVISEKAGASRSVSHG